MPRHAPDQLHLSPQSLISLPPPPPPLPRPPSHKKLEYIAISGLVTGIILYSLLFIVFRSRPVGDDQDQHHDETETERGNDHDIESNGTGSRNPQSETTKTRLDALTTTSFVSDKNSGDSCAVCLEQLVDGDECRVLPECNHVYHKTCIDDWLLNKNHCPLCRVCVWATNFDQTHHV